MTEDFDQDRYPSVDSCFAEAKQHDDFPEGDIERFELTLLASGDATWRAWPARADEPVGGYIPAS